MVDSRPLDFGKFWYALGKELSDLPVAPEVSPIPLRSNKFCDLYGVTLTSVGPYRIFGILVFPRVRGRFLRFIMFLRTLVFLKLFLKEHLIEFAVGF